MFETFDHPAITVMLTAHTKARELDSYFIGAEHVLLALLDTQASAIEPFLYPVSLTIDDFRVQVQRIADAKGAEYSKEEGDETTMHFTEGTKLILRHASQKAKSCSRQVTADDILTVMFGSWKISPNDLRKSIEEHLNSLDSEAKGS